MFKFKKNIKINKAQKNDSILILSAVLLLILSGFLVFWFSSRRFEPEASVLKVIGRASLTIDFGNGEKRAFEGSIIENETPIDVLNQAAKAGNFSYKLDEKSNLAAIDNFLSNKNKSWRWYLNGEKINKPVNEISLKSEDKILIKHE